MRRIALIAALIAAAAVGVAASAGADGSHTYKIELYNAFGLVNGSDVRVAGVNSGTVTDLGITAEKRAVATVELSGDYSVLGTETRCSSEPQSLIAEYFLDCQPKGPPLADGGTIPASHVTMTVQSDLVQNTLRQPFAQRLQLLINEFGTALAGNPEDLNKAILLGSPALRNLKRVLDILGDENTTIRDLNANSDRIIAELTARKEQLIRFIQEARDTAEVSAERRADLSKNFDLLDNFLQELHPTLVELGKVARNNASCPASTQTQVVGGPLPQGCTGLLPDLNAAAPQLNRLSKTLPAFNDATRKSLVSLGKAAEPGAVALRQGIDEIQLLRDSGENAATAAETLNKFLLDIGDPGRHVETDARAARTCNDPTLPCWSTGRDAPTGYSGIEGLLNYVYYQAGALNQFDAAGHLLHFSLFDVGLGPCGTYNAGPTVPKAGGGTTTDILEADNCVSWLGANQPGISTEPGINDISPYDPSVCPQGSDDLEFCDPGGPKRKHTGTKTSGGGKPGAGNASQPGSRSGTGLPSLPGGSGLLGGLGDLLGLGQNHHHNGGLLGGGGGLLGKSGSNATAHLLDFLFAN